MRTAAIIPARGGSKGLKNKNIHPIAGLPLLAWSVLQALDAEHVDQVFVTTDDAAIAQVARQFGAEVIDRPERISGDKATSESALLHALEVIAERYGAEPETVVFLQATSPLRKPGDIDRAIELFRLEGADSLISVTRADDLTIWEQRGGDWNSVNFDYRNRGMRQDRPSQFIENGSIYLFTPSVLREFGNRIGQKLSVYLMEFWQTWEIDTIEEVDLVEFYLKQKGIDRSFLRS
ncbi:MAG TPA: acylneuraminate cytidylyltransferase family protein [Chlorobaculum sp.]|jgi:N-acylneuraminate cytidylyltransferase|uniref:Acylneuraminate cytidylyltransferase n=1 Tax=Chlorobaculum tepidum (strain ATCC 49652 / DSM 12025 / NBRC 103806 / TLS) TaxID=194439 RepID=Q8KDA1_CHLTE|nr:acylneuraminate cytidylyltransferase family protein [Chlorobaculum tepidum]AAM72386.1 acylneuraminate cytidylyltransferase [Chlorobaculum tepidum TLS]HBU23974.1 acylneuraminate cytidylyltransferase family protein [Chlorobaculum sp.]